MSLKRYNVLTNRPSLEVTERKYRLDKILAIIFGIALTFAVLVLWPSVSLSAGAMDLKAFTHWGLNSLVTNFSDASQMYLKHQSWGLGSRPRHFVLGGCRGSQGGRGGREILL